MPAESIVIRATPEQVWSMVSDVTRIGEWSPEAVGAEWLDGASAPVVGARFKGRSKRKGSWATTCTVSAASRPREFAFVVGKGETAWSYELEAQDVGCELRESFEILKAPGAVGRFMTKLGTGVRWSEREHDLVLGMQKTLCRLKAAAEG